MPYAAASANGRNVVVGNRLFHGQVKADNVVTQKPAPGIGSSVANAVTRINKCAAKFNKASYNALPCDNCETWSNHGSDTSGMIFQAPCKSVMKKDKFGRVWPQSCLECQARSASNCSCLDLPYLRLNEAIQAANNLLGVVSGTLSAITDKAQRQALEKQVEEARNLLAEYDEPEEEVVVLGNANEQNGASVVSG
ncbi:hypothetical protein HD553DRAFT_344158 [Filobasidium floriforme]|uniref:uncharacterized protein n=1 Tax=Filobasidium floriforme TaxID=5210 RepID=UPI001E8ED424|nr:uncharacterized protein HD553DRAFT_344158 [Filobasidium floriforme]KAH8081457.1 hypothetical protein HD553DRAFT_344158 [Filobasidium floriforme]